MQQDILCGIRTPSPTPLTPHLIHPSPVHPYPRTLPPKIAPYHMSHNAEPEAVDLLLEVERLDMLEALCDDKNYGR